MSKLIFQYGSMNASKSANLIMDWYGHKQNNKGVLVFKPSLDTRNSKVSSRALNTTIEADLVVGKYEYGKMFDMALKHEPRMIFVDEVQFLDKEQINELARIVDIVGVSVQAYGLMTTFKGELFEGSKRLVELADVVERIRSECTICSREGVMNARYVDGEFQLDGETVVVGKEEAYKVLCRKHFMKELVLKKIGEKNMPEETVTISKSEYEYLLEQNEFLNCLESCGVDNWSGYSYAREMMEEEE